MRFRAAVPLGSWSPSGRPADVRTPRSRVAAPSARSRSTTQPSNRRVRRSPSDPRVTEIRVEPFRRPRTRVTATPSLLRTRIGTAIGCRRNIEAVVAVAHTSTIANTAHWTKSRTLGACWRSRGFRGQIPAAIQFVIMVAIQQVGHTHRQRGGEQDHPSGAVAGGRALVPPTTPRRGAPTTMRPSPRHARPADRQRSPAARSTSVARRSTRTPTRRFSPRSAKPTTQRRCTQPPAPRRRGNPTPSSNDARPTVTATKRERDPGH